MTTTQLTDNSVMDAIKKTDAYRQWAAEFNRSFREHMMKESAVLPFAVIHKPNPLWLRLRTVAKRMRKSA